MGDDATDEDMFAALDDDDISIHVGPGASRARLRVENVDAARRFLWGLLASDHNAAGVPGLDRS
jgi:trehalose-6-phosphatase